MAKKARVAAPSIPRKPICPTERYAGDVADGRIVAGPLVKATCERHLDDLVRGHERGLVWDGAAAGRTFGFFRDALRLNGGDFEGLPFELRPWQQFIIGSLFGWKRDTGARRFRTSFTEIGKGNGKSPMAAGVGIKMFCADDEQRAEIYSAGAKKDQAQILFRDAVAMVKLSPALRKHIVISGGRAPHNLAYPRTGSFFRPISADKKQSGPRPHCSLVDEIHEHANRIVLDQLQSGIKGRRQPLTFEITNSGVDRTSICWEHHEYSEKVARRQLQDDTWFSYVCGLAEGDSWQDELIWPKANPNLGVSIQAEYLRDQVRKAQGMPAFQSTVRRLNFCEWVGSLSPWIDEAQWNKTLGDVDLKALRRRKCYGAVDLSGKNDLTALTLVFPLDGGRFTAVTWFWTPRDTMQARAERDRVPYPKWIEDRFIEATPGKSIDYDFVAEKLARLGADYEIVELAFDRYRIDDLSKAMSDIGLAHFIAANPDDIGNGIRLTKHGQGYAGMSPAVDALETAILNEKLTVARNPVMTFCASNAVLDQDAAGNRKFDKRAGRSYGRIDGVVTLAMATRIATIASPTTDLGALIASGMAIL